PPATTVTIHPNVFISVLLFDQFQFVWKEIVKTVVDLGAGIAFDADGDVGAIVEIVMNGFDASGASFEEHVHRIGAALRGEAHARSAGHGSSGDRYGLRLRLFALRIEEFFAANGAV